MKEYTSIGGALSFVYPVDWDIAESKNLINVFDPINGVGVLQFSFYLIPDTQNIELKDELEEYLRDRHKSFSIAVNANYVFTDYADEIKGRYWKYWVYLRNGYLVFATYNCETEDSGKEDRVINEVIQSALKG